MHIDPCDHMSNTAWSDVSVSIPQPAPLQSNGSGYNTIQWCTWEESIQRGSGGSVQSLRENTRWECTITYINESCSMSRVILGSSEIFWGCPLDIVQWVLDAMRDRLVQMLLRESYRRQFSKLFHHWHWKSGREVHFISGNIRIRIGRENPKHLNNIRLNPGVSDESGRECVDCSLEWDLHVNAPAARDPHTMKMMMVWHN